MKPYRFACLHCGSLTRSEIGAKAHICNAQGLAGFTEVGSDDYKALVVRLTEIRSRSEAKSAPAMAELMVRR